jgi:glycerophosphoryl diester phosphodiesterase
VAPENTLAASEIARALGYRYLETDVHLPRDGVLVAFHDDRLDRVTDRSGAIAQPGIAEVEAADAGHAFSADCGRRFPFRGCGIRVPRLERSSCVGQTRGSTSTRSRIHVWGRSLLC